MFKYFIALLIVTLFGVTHVQAQSCNTYGSYSRGYAVRSYPTNFNRGYTKSYSTHDSRFYGSPTVTHQNRVRVCDQFGNCNVYDTSSIKRGSSTYNVNGHPLSGFATFGGQYGAVQGYSNAGFYADSVQLKRIGLFKQAIQLGVASPHEVRFSGFLSANDEAVLRARIRQSISAQRDAYLLNPFLSGGVAHSGY